MKRYKALLWSATVLAVLVAVFVLFKIRAGEKQNQSIHNQPTDSRYKLEQIREIEIKTKEAGISLVAQQSDEVYAEAASAEDGSVRLTEKLTADGRLEISYAGVPADTLFLYLSPDYARKLRLTTVSGSITLSGYKSLSVMDAASQSGLISISKLQAGSVKIRNDHGENKLTGIAANEMSVKARNGGITLTDTSIGELSVTNDSGETSVNSPLADFRFEGKSGGLQLVIPKLTTGAQVRTDRGSIRLVVPRDGEYQLSVDNPDGSTSCQAGDNAGWLAAYAADGHTLNAGASGPKMEIKAKSGDITIE